MMVLWMRLLHDLGFCFWPGGFGRRGVCVAGCGFIWRCGFFRRLLLLAFKINPVSFGRVGVVVVAATPNQGQRQRGQQGGHGMGQWVFHECISLLKNSAPQSIMRWRSVARHGAAALLCWLALR
ncbi:MAG: hypothetical protein LBP52_09780 [Burkholderiaceae bacterium]|nr:hypothetical protein [Burkholderiaceae bacterium]